MGQLSMLLALVFASTLLVSSVAGQCDSEAGDAPCPGGVRGKGSGRCGGGADAHRDPSQGHQSQSSGDGGGKDLSSLITRCLFDYMLKHRNDPACNASNFYTYDAFLTAAKAFDGFGTTGDLDTRKKELAAFLAQTSHETTGWWATAPDGPFTWGYCLKEDAIKLDFCVRSPQWPCVQGKQYYGRGPMKLYFNYNYGPAGKAIGVDLLSKPELVATDAVISFKTAIWYWMTPHPLKPSCHDVITGVWKPSTADKAARRVPGYGVITNILRGEYECGHGTDTEALDRVGFYKAYSDILGVSPGDNLNCEDQIPFGWTERPYIQK